VIENDPANHGQPPQPTTLYDHTHKPPRHTSP